MRVKNIPNLLTVLRVMLIVPLLYFLFTQNYGWALAFFMIAAASDGLDGYLARRYQWQSHLGSIIDPIADKLFLITCFITLYWLGHLPLWLIVLVLGRDLIIVLGALAYYFLIGKYDMKPSMISKFNTFFQIALIFMVLLHLATALVPNQMILGFIYIVFITSTISCVDYVVIWSAKALQASRGENG